MSPEFIRCTCVFSTLAFPYAGLDILQYDEIDFSNVKAEKPFEQKKKFQLQKI
jgi:hypothetical protein